MRQDMLYYIFNLKLIGSNCNRKSFGNCQLQIIKQRKREQIFMFESGVLENFLQALLLISKFQNEESIYSDKTVFPNLNTREKIFIIYTIVRVNCTKIGDCACQQNVTFFTQVLPEGPLSNSTCPSFRQCVSPFMCPSSSISDTAYHFFVKFCMKLGVNKGKKVTRLKF